MRQSSAQRPQKPGPTLTPPLLLSLVLVTYSPPCPPSIDEVTGQAAPAVASVYSYSVSGASTAKARTLSAYGVRGILKDQIRRDRGATPRSRFCLSHQTNTKVRTTSIEPNDDKVDRDRKYEVDALNSFRCAFNHKSLSTRIVLKDTMNITALSQTFSTVCVYSWYLLRYSSVDTIPYLFCIYIMLYPVIHLF